MPEQWWAIAEEVLGVYRRFGRLSGPDFELLRYRVVCWMERLWLAGERDPANLRQKLCGYSRSYAHNRRRRPSAFTGIAEDAYPSQDDCAPSGMWQWAMGFLSERETQVVSLHLSSGWTFVRISQQVGMSPQGAHNAYCRAIKKLRRQANDFTFRDES